MEGGSGNGKWHFEDFTLKKKSERGSHRGEVHEERYRTWAPEASFKTF